MTIAEAMEQAVGHLQAGRLNEAEELLRTILARQPDSPYALNYLGLVLNQRGQIDEAAGLMRRSVAGKPPVAHLYTNLAGVLMSLRDFAGAEAAARTGIQLDPNLAQARLDLGNALWAQRKMDEAVAEFRRGIQVDPRRWELHEALGLCLQDMGRTDESLAELQRAVDLDPNQPANVANLAAAQLNAHRVEQAIESGRRAVALVPDEPGAHYSLAMALLTAGDWMAGWQEYEWRLQIMRLNPEPRVYMQDVWDGSAPEGRSLLLYTEENPADAIMFARHIPPLAERGAKIVLECQPELVQLMRTVPGITQVVGRGDALPSFDVHVPLASLPRVFGTTPQNMPGRAPWMHPPEDRLQAARQRIAQEAGNAKLKVGLSWIGSNVPAQQKRLLGIQPLAPLGGLPGVRWYNLGPTSGARQTIGGSAIVDLFPTFRDFADLAAAIAPLDLVITADTIVPHIAGAMGKESWLLLPYAADWRWMLDREDTPWYPTVRLFRQGTPGDWATPVSRITEALRVRCTP